MAAALVLTAGLWALSGCGRKARRTADRERAEILSLEKELDGLRTRAETLSGSASWAQGLPEAPLVIGLPTALAADIIRRVTAGFADRLTIELKNLKVRKDGRLKKVITLGDYSLRITINRVTARLKTGRPEITFGGNAVAVALPVDVDSGDWRATLNFKWDGKNISGAVCGDLDITQEMTGGVRPDRYDVAGALKLTASPRQILARPDFPPLRLRLRVEPSEESWAAARKILDDKTGVCGFVLDRVNVMGTVRRLLDKGFVVRLPTEKIKPVALPVGLNPSFSVGGEKQAMGITVSELAVTPQMIWLGAGGKVSGAVGR